MEPTTTTTTSGTTQRTPPPSPPAGGDTDTKMAIYTSTITPSTLFSPLKRKREGLPLPPPPAAWQEEEGEGGGVESEGSLHSGRLALQLEGLSLGQVEYPLDAGMACGDGVVVDGDDRDKGGEEEDGDGRVVGKRTRLVSPPLAFERGGGCGSSGDEEAGDAPVPHPMHRNQEGAAAAEEEEEGEEDSDWGLSGVGVKPSARQSYIRAQKKLQQIREYKSRVSKEAREKRSWERRRRKSFTNGNTTAAAAVTKGLMHRSEGEEDEGDFRGRRKRVHFDV